MMNILKYLIFACSLIGSSLTLAQSIDYIAVPASGFTPRNSTTIKDPLKGTVETLGYSGNASGTARFFGDNNEMFAPVFLAHNSKIVSFSCAGNSANKRTRIRYYLRRNQPQQANVDMASVFSAHAETGFQRESTTLIQSPMVDNKTYNYYIVASIDATNNIRECKQCSVNTCSIGYVTPTSNVSRKMKAVKLN
jgi:hypothetical protein